MKLSAPGLASGLILCAACSVLEDRSLCPCHVVWYVGLDRSAGTEMDWYLDDGETLEWGVVDLSQAHQCEWDVRRGACRMTAFFAEAGTLSPGSGLVIREGADCPEIFLWTAETVLEGDEWTQEVRGHKAFARLLLRTVGLGEYSFEVTGNVSGYDSAGNPREGRFRSPMTVGDNGEYKVNVPRQTDTSLRLVLYRDAAPVRSFAIGEYIARSGFDWTAEDLEDLDVELVYRETSAIFRISAWEKRLTFSITF